MGIPNLDNAKSFMLFWLLLAKEKVTWKKLAFSLQSGSNGQKSSWSEILGAPPEEYMVGVLHETNDQLTSWIDNGKAMMYYVCQRCG